MPIKIPDDLPARRKLEAEGVVVMRAADAVRQDIRPLRIGLLNLMPNKITTETQIARLLGATPLQIELSLVQITDHAPRNTPAEHMLSFYRPWEEVKDERFDGFIITGAPVERLPFEQVTYWDELRRIFDWTQTHVHRGLNICWAAQAAVHHFHGMQKYDLPAKAFGIYRHQAPPASAPSPYLRGLADEFAVPVSRWSEVRKEEIPADSGIVVLAENAETGLCVLDDTRHRAVHIFNHLEYDTQSLGDEYFRDVSAGLDVPVPVDYFRNDDPAEPAVNSWRGSAHILFGNWVNEIYQTVPFDIDRIGRTTEDVAA